jgi:hypothetical protein
VQTTVGHHFKVLFQVSTMPLVDFLRAKKIGWGACGGGRHFALPTDWVLILSDPVDMVHS